jgi:hypothetical protein
MVLSAGTHLGPYEILTVATPGPHARQFKAGKLGGCNATMTEFWNEALAA